MEIWTREQKDKAIAEAKRQERLYRIFRGCLINTMSRFEILQEVIELYGNRTTNNGELRGEP
jgi:hypothetical protein